MCNELIIRQNTDKLMAFVAQKFERGELDNESLVQLIELAGGYLNLSTIPNYCRSNRMSYNGAKKYRKVVVLFGVKFVIDNN